MPLFSVPETNGIGREMARSRLVDGRGNPFNSNALESDNPAAPERDQALPHIYQLSAMLGASFQTYQLRRHDEAMKHSYENARAMRRDAFLMGLLQERALGVASLRWHIEVDNDRDAQQKAIKDGLTAILKSTPHLQKLFYYVEEETIWTGRGGSQFVWHWKDMQLPAVPVKSFGTGMPGGLGGMNSGLPGQRPGKPPSIGEQRGLYAANPFGQDGENPDKSQEKGVNKFPAQKNLNTLGMNPATSEPERKRALSIRTHQPISGDSITHEYDGTPVLIVYPAAFTTLQGIREVKTNLGRGIALQGTWRQRFLLDYHMPVASEFFDYASAEAIHGVGIRSVIYWVNWLREEWLSNVADWCERTGLGIRLWYYQGGNPESKKQVAKAAADQDSKVNLLVPRYGDKAVEGVDVIETATGGADLLHRLMLYVDEIIERFFVGQSLSSGRDNDSGLGGTGRAKFAESTKNKLIAFDANSRADTITEDWLKLVLRWTYPDFADLPCRFVFDVYEEDPKDLLESTKTFVELGGEVREDDVRGKLGFREPMEGDKILKSKPEPFPGIPGKAPPGGQDTEEDGGDAIPEKPPEDEPAISAGPNAQHNPEDKQSYQREPEWTEIPDDAYPDTDLIRYQRDVEHLGERLASMERKAEIPRSPLPEQQPVNVNVSVAAEAMKYAQQTLADAERAKEEAERSTLASTQSTEAKAETEKLRYAAEEAGRTNETKLAALADRVSADVDAAKAQAQAATEAAEKAAAALKEVTKTVKQIAKGAADLAKSNQEAVARISQKADEITAASALSNRPRKRTAKKNKDGSVTILEEPIDG